MENRGRPRKETNPADIERRKEAGRRIVQLRHENRWTQDELAEKVRTAIDENLLQYFPKVFEDAMQKNYTDLLRKRALLQIQAIVKDEDKEDEIKSVTEQIYRMQNPKGFMGAESEEVRFDKQFEDMCLLMAKEFGGGIKKYTTMEFYTAFERLSKQYNEAKKIRSKKR